MAVERPAEKNWPFLLNLGRNFFSATPEILRHDERRKAKKRRSRRAQRQIEEMGWKERRR